MDEIHARYRTITGRTDVPGVMKLSHTNGDRDVWDEFLNGHFRLHLEDILHDGAIPDGLFDILKIPKSIECHALLVYHDGSQQRSLYFEVNHIDDPLVSEALANVAEGSKLDLRLKGKDLQTVVRQLTSYIGPERVIEITGKQGYGVVYDYEGRKCIDAWVTCENGIHVRVANELTQTVDRDNDQTIIKNRNREAQVRSIMGLLTLGAKKGDSITLMAQGPKAEEEVVRIYQKWREINSRRY